MKKDDWPREKNWKHVYTRSNKLNRAKKLGFVYPRESETNMADRESLKILFVCTMNQWRSPTAERIYADKPLVVARSCGASAKASKTVRGTDLQWADVVLVLGSLGPMSKLSLGRRVLLVTALSSISAAINTGW